MFQNNHHYWMQSFFANSMFFLTWWNNFAAVKVNEAVEKRTWKDSEIRNNIDTHSIEWELIMFINIRQRSKLTFSKSRLLETFNCKMVTITWLSPEFWSPKIFSTCHGDQNGRSLERCSVTVIVQLTKQSYLFLTFGSHISYCYT